MQYSFLKVASVSIETKIANVCANVDEIIKKIDRAAACEARIIVFPELTLTGYSCQDLFFGDDLQNAVLSGLAKICADTEQIDSLIFVGAPLQYRGRLYNCALVIFRGQILAVVPKTYIPDYAEFFEQRYFTSGALVEQGEIQLLGQCVPFGNRLILEHPDYPNLKVACEICEDLWSPLSPSTLHSLAGANIICNLSASNDYLGKYEERRQLLLSHSKKSKTAYIYASAGRGESTADVIYSDYKCIVELGSILAEANYDQDIVYAYIDLQAVAYAKNAQSRLSASLSNLDTYRYLAFNVNTASNLAELNRYMLRNPFLDGLQRERALQDVFALQKKSLLNRLQSAKIKNIVLGLSGGLDSTLAALVAVDLAREYDWIKLHFVSMPCFGTSEQTRGNAGLLTAALGIEIKEIDIKLAANMQMQLIEHEIHGDVTYENVQARQRTAILLNMANKYSGLVLGTADLSETALGFCTYGGDHLSMYNINASIPKTVIREIVAWWGKHSNNAAAEKVLLDIIATPISPELLPVDACGNIQQSTEEIVGNYDLIDYVLYYHLTNQFSRDKILFLAKQAFAGVYSEHEVKKAVDSYFDRFYKNQFKRTCAPDGAKVTCISLSPRSSWRMPSDM